MSARSRSVAALLGLGVVLLATAGCFNPFRPLTSNEPAVITPAPVPNSPQNIVRLFQWCWENRDDLKYREVFTGDFVFDFATTDTAGSFYRTNPWNREDELIAAHNLFVAGSASDAPASNITMVFTPADLTPDIDPRPGKTFPWHQKIQARTNLTIQKTDGTAYQVVTDAEFYVVRGDSAQIPKDLGPSFGPDPNRWYIERQVELNPSTGPAAALRPAGAAGLAAWSAVGGRPATATPLVPVTWGRVRVNYRAPQVGAPARISAAAPGR